jgi:hypothetical protein
MVVPIRTAYERECIERLCRQDALKHDETGLIELKCVYSTTTTITESGIGEP